LAYSYRIFVPDGNTTALVMEIEPDAAETLECKDNIFMLNVTVQLERQWDDENANEAEEIGVQL